MKTRSKRPETPPSNNGQTADASPKHFHWGVVSAATGVSIGLGIVTLALALQLDAWIGRLLSVVFVTAAIYGVVRKWWAAGWCCTLLLVGAALFFASQTWMQAFIKQEALSCLLSVSQKAGEKLDEFQKTTVTVQEQVAGHQRKLGQHQDEIGAMQVRLTTAQSRIQSQQVTVANQQTALFDAQNRLVQQQQKLADVESLIDGMYNRMRFENFKGTDSNGS